MARALVDLTGRRFGKLVVLSLVHKKPKVVWLCACDCGRMAEIVSYNLKRLDGESTTHCGCRRTTKERLLSKIKIDEATGCWNWTRYISKRGYGMLTMKGQKHMYGYRLSYEAFVGPIPEGLHVCHHCDNRRCINPDHLFVGTHQDNMRDMISKGRAWFQQVRKQRAAA